MTIPPTDTTRGQKPLTTLSPRLLLVDAASRRRRLLHEQLSTAGCRVVTVASASEAEPLLLRGLADATLSHRELGIAELERLERAARGRDVALFLYGDIDGDPRQSLSSPWAEAPLGEDGVMTATSISALLARRRSRSEGGDRTVWVVDDNPAVIALLTSIFKREGLTVVGSEALHEALDRLDDGCRSKLVMLDVNLPDGSGLDLLRAIRRRSDVPVVMITNLNDPALLQEAFELGADEFIEKPFRPRELITRALRLV